MFFPSRRPRTEPAMAPTTVAMVVPEPLPIWVPAAPPTTPPSTAPVSPPVQSRFAQPLIIAMAAHRATTSVIDLLISVSLDLLDAGQFKRVANERNLTRLQF